MIAIVASAEEIQALLQLLQRTPMSQAEQLFIESVFNRWFDTFRQSMPQSSDASITPDAGDPPIRA